MLNRIFVNYKSFERIHVEHKFGGTHVEYKFLEETHIEPEIFVGL